jgi:hypothetical protein
MHISSLHLDLASLSVVRDRIKAAIEQRVRSVKDVELTIDEDQLLIWIKDVDYGRFVPNFDLRVGVQARLASFDQEVLVINTRVYKLGIIPPGVIELVLCFPSLLNKLHQLLERWGKKHGDICPDEILSVATEGHWLFNLGKLPVRHQGTLTDVVQLHRVSLPGDDGYAMTILFSERGNSYVQTTDR